MYGSDEQLLELLGQRLARQRLDRNWTQQRLAQEAGLSLPTVKRMESGAGGQLSSLLRLLRALDLLANWEALVPRSDLRPLELLDRSRPRRQRASSRRERSEKEADGWVWGQDREGS